MNAEERMSEKLIDSLRAKVAELEKQLERRNKANELTFLIKSTYIMVDALKAISDEGIDSVDDTETEVIARIKIIADKALNQYSELYEGRC